MKQDNLFPNMLCKYPHKWGYLLRVRSKTADMAQKKIKGRQPPTLWVARPRHIYSPHCYILGIYK